MTGDLSVIGPQATINRYVVTGGTKIRAGEPIHSLGITYSSGTVNTNTYVLAAADTPVIGTHRLGGIAIKNALLAAAGTVVTQYLPTAVPIANDAGRIRGKAEVAANVDTAAELAAIIGDVVLIDYAATGASDGGPLYTIKDTASADTSGLKIEEGNTAKGTLDVSVDGDAYRSDRS